MPNTKTVLIYQISLFIDMFSMFNLLISVQYKFVLLIYCRFRNSCLCEISKGSEKIELCFSTTSKMEYSKRNKTKKIQNFIKITCYWRNFPYSAHNTKTVLYQISLLINMFSMYNLSISASYQFVLLIYYRFRNSYLCEIWKKNG